MASGTDTESSQTILEGEETIQDITEDPIVEEIEGTTGEISEVINMDTNATEVLTGICQKLDTLATKDDLHALTKLFTDKLNKLEEKVVALETERESVRAEVEKVKAENTQLKQQVQDLARKAGRHNNDQEQYSRRWNLRIFDRSIKVFAISATGDGQLYGNTVNLTVYDSTCQNCTESGCKQLLKCKMRSYYTDRNIFSPYFVSSTVDLATERKTDTGHADRQALG
nr:hypothetical protein BaRGS_021997 [Batillaria attramentaria]